MGILEMMNKISLADSLLFIVFFLLVLTFASVCSSEPAGGRTWEFYGKSKGGSSYYFSKIHKAKSSDVTSVWSYEPVTEAERKEKIEHLLKYNPEESIKYKNYSYNILRIEINCKQKLNRVVEIMSYDNKGHLLDHGIFDNEWRRITPKSMNEKLYKKNCLAEDKPSIEKVPYRSNWAQYGNLMGLFNKI